MTEIIIEAKNVNKLFGIRHSEAMSMLKKGADKESVLKKTNVTTALYDVNLKIPRGKIFVIIGLSGSGKSTLVRCFNRLTQPTSGSILFEGIDLMKKTKKELREFRRHKISMVFQSFGLMTHRNIIKNVSYGLEVSGVPADERKKRAEEAIELVGLEGWSEAKTHELSGGMLQRVGLARALASNPDVLLMDEPFSALDPLVRQDMQFELLSIQRKLEKTVIFITHDIDEAFKLGDIVAIMRDGRIVQVDTPERMSMHPVDDYVRHFVESADTSKFLTVKDIMVKPTSLIKSTDSLDGALRVMQKSGLSSVYVIDNKMKFMGILKLTEALNAKKEKLPLLKVLIKDDGKTVSRDALIEDIMPLATTCTYPLAVVDEENRLLGIVSKASVLSSLI